MIVLSVQEARSTTYSGRDNGRQKAQASLKTCRAISVKNDSRSTATSPSMVATNRSGGMGSPPSVSAISRFLASSHKNPSGVLGRQIVR